MAASFVPSHSGHENSWDAVETYFHCITECSLDDGECVTRCVEDLRASEDAQTNSQHM
tara:strand:+ start:1545 stop:1718 length:174 start_codon:yes stop_codon:yes gene_type:complete